MLIRVSSESLVRLRACFNQLLLVILINVPTVSFGLAMGWVSLASGETAEAEETGHMGEVVIAAGTTFLASLLGVPLSACALVAGRKVAVIATSFCFVVCWSLKMVGHGWWLVGARMAAGLGGAGAWSVAPLLAREMCSVCVRGAAVAALVLAHNLGILLMYLAAEVGLHHRTVLWWCLGLSLAHCLVFLLMPESPAFLASRGRMKEARAALLWLRGSPTAAEGEAALALELAALPPPPTTKLLSPFKRAKHMLRDGRRRRAFAICAVAVVGQEMCGVLALLQFAERVFMLARDEGLSPTDTPRVELVSPAGHAVLLGVVQLLASAVALYLIEKIGRRPLLVGCAYATGLCLLGGAGAVWWGARKWAAWALAGAVAADSMGLQPVPYSLLADCFAYEFRACALMLVTALGCIGNTMEIFTFAALAASQGVAAALLLAAALTLAYSVFVSFAVPETKDKTLDQIYDAIGPDSSDSKHSSQFDAHSASTKLHLLSPSFKLGWRRADDTRKTIVSRPRNDTRPRGSISGGMGLLDKLSSWLGKGGTEVWVLVLGLDNSGKSTLLNALRPPEHRAQHVLPTVGHQQDHFQSGGVSFSAWDVSGATRHRALWERHYRRADAVIFVVDSADHLRLVVAREELELMLSHPDMFGRRVPLLLFANKSDAPHALTPLQVSAALCLERISDKPWHVSACSALSGDGLSEGIAWLSRQLRDLRAHR